MRPGNVWSSCLRSTSCIPSTCPGGWLHAGNTRIVGIHPPAPSDYVGWTNQELARFWEDPRYLAIDEQLQRDLTTPPTLRCAWCYRSLKWHIDPEEYPLALRMIEAIATDETSDWAPEVIFAHQAGISPRSHPHAKTAQELWLEMVQATPAVNQQRVDQEPWLAWRRPSRQATRSIWMRRSVRPRAPTPQRGSASSCVASVRTFLHLEWRSRFISRIFPLPDVALSGARPPH